MPFETLSLSQRIKRCREFCAPYRVTDGDKFGLKKFDPDDTGDLEAEDKPRAKDLDHDYLWRYMKRLPERGRIGIFNRSYYEGGWIHRSSAAPEVFAEGFSGCFEAEG